MSLNCGATIRFPSSCLDGNGMILPSGLWFTKEGVQFDTLAEAGDDANWNEKIIDGDIVVIHGIKEAENISGEDVVYESPGQDITFLFSGKKRMKFKFYTSIDQHKALLGFNGNRVRMGFYDRANHIVGASPDGSIFRAPKVSYLRVGDLIIPTDASPAFTMIDIQFAQNADLNELLHLIKPDVGTIANRWYPFELINLTTVTLEQVGAIATNTATFDVSLSATSVTDNDGASIKTASVDGLDVSTFLNTTLTLDGVVTAPDSMTDEGVVAGKARYTITQSTMGAATIVTQAIKPSLTQPYQSATETYT